jgi:membrane-associated phospholipid phosphatase
MKKVHVIFLMAAALLPFTTWATEQTDNSDPIVSDSLTMIVEETDPAINVAHPIPACVPVSDNGTSIVSEPPVTGQLSGRELSLDADLYRHYNGPDFSFLKNTTNPAVKPYTFLQDQTWVGIPLFLAGIIAKGEKEAFRQDYRNTNTKIRLVKYDFHSEIDNYTQFSGIALTAGLKMAGVEGRSSWPRLFASSLASYGVMAAFVNGIKYTASELRPDGSTHNSWPSGHTATAFVGATILHKEYGLTRSPWYSIGGYTLATATGVMRVLNNRHWISDVLSGAGIGILSTELAYGICDLLFKEKGLLMNDLSVYPDLSVNPSFFSISMGIGLGNKNLTLPGFVFGIVADDASPDTEPLKLQFRSATAVGAEGAWFFNPYIGIGGRLRVKSTPINGWSQFTDLEKKSLKEIAEQPEFQDAINYFDIEIQSDHITEFAADAGLYFSLPLSPRFAIGSKLLIGHSIMDDIDVEAKFLGDRIDYDDDGNFFPTGDEVAFTEWDYINVHASNSMKFGTGLSLTYAYKNSFSWRVFCDYDYSHKTYTATYAPFMYVEKFCPRLRQDLIDTFHWDPVQEFKSSASKHLNQWVLGGALCVSF